MYFLNGYMKSMEKNTIIYKLENGFKMLFIVLLYHNRFIRYTIKFNNIR